MFSILTKQLIAPALLSGLLIGGAAGYGGWTVRGWRCDAAVRKVEQQAAKDKAALQAQVDEKSAAYEASKAEHAEKTVIRQNTIREIYRDVKVPAECEPPVGVSGVLRDAVTAANTRITGEP